MPVASLAPHVRRGLLSVLSQDIIKKNTVLDCARGDRHFNPAPISGIKERRASYLSHIVYTHTPIMAPLLPSHRRPGSGGGGSGNKALIKVLLLAMGLGGIIMMQSFASKLGTRPIPTPDPRAYIHTYHSEV